MENRGIAIIGFGNYDKILLQNAIEAALGIDIQGYVADFIIEDELRRLDDSYNNFEFKQLLDYEDYDKGMHNCPPRGVSQKHHNFVMSLNKKNRNRR